MTEKCSKKNLHIINIPWYSGLAGYGIDMGKYMEDMREKVVFAVVEDSPLHTKIKNNFEVIALPGRSVFKTLLGLFKIWGLSYNIKMIFAHTGSSFFMGVIIGLLRGIPVYRVRAESGRVKKNIFNILMHKLAKGIVVPNELIKNDFLKFGAREDKIFLLPPVIDTDKFCYSPLPENMTIALLGRLDEVKGHKVLIESLPLIRKKVKNIKVIFIGREEGVKWSKLKKYAEKFDVANIIEYTGYMSDDKIVEIMSNSRIGIIPSLGSEAVSRVALEWMACGRPVVASNVGCMREVIKNGINGFLVNPDDSHSIAAKIIEILTDVKLNAKMAKNARKYVEEFHSTEIFSQKIKEFING